MQRSMLCCLAASRMSGLRFFNSKSVEEMAQELRDKIGYNSVGFTTVDKFIHIDLAGKAHYDKLVQDYIPTPHVQAHAIHRFHGKIRIAKKPTTTIPATRDDVRLARKLAGEK